MGVNGLKHALVHITDHDLTYNSWVLLQSYDNEDNQNAAECRRRKKVLILLTSSTDKKPPHAGRANRRREIITALAITDSWASGRPWWRRRLSRYSLCAHCDKMNWMCESILKLDWKITPNSLQQSNCSISSRGGGIWKYCTRGRLNTVSFVLERFSLRQFIAAQAFTFWNSTCSSTSVCWGTKSVVSSA